jgi:arsenate reductase (glutaredoxin)
MSWRVWAYDGCSTCKKAVAWLRANDVAHEVIPIVERPPSAAELERLWKRSGLPLKRFFNTSGQSYRAGRFGERLPTLTEKEALAALAADGKLVKRPLVDTGDAVFVGFDPATWEKSLSK